MCHEKAISTSRVIRMYLIERHSLVTISPNYAHDENAGGDYKWRMNVSLPFPFPARKCVKQELQLEPGIFRFGIHNHFDRIFAVPKLGKAIPKVHLVEKSFQGPISDQVVARREILQSVAVFEQSEVFADRNAAFAGAAKKIKACTEYLSIFLGKCQKAAPFLTAWMVYPFSPFEVGTIFHEVLHRCPDAEEWHMCASTIAMSMARHLQRPLFYIDLPNDDPDDVLSVTHELLAESQMALFRGIPRSSVLSAYGAVELFARHVLSKKCVERLESLGTPRSVAEEIATERIPDQKKVDYSFLFHGQMKKESGRSLFDERKQAYDDLGAFQKVRNRVAHHGYRPSEDEARAGHRTCCEVAQWLAEVGGYKSKPLLPPEKDTFPGISVFSADSFGKSEEELALIRQLLGIKLKKDLPQRGVK